MSEPIRFKLRPLQKWPREQTPAGKRKQRPFPSRIGYDRSLRDLRKELQYLKPDGPVVIELGLREQDIRIDGAPRGDAPPPKFPGVIVSFRGKWGPMQFVCDDCVRWTDNVRAIMLTLERLRLADRYGVTKRGEQYTGWKALPGPIITPAPMTVEQAAAFLHDRGADPAERIMSDAGVYRSAYRFVVRQLHPDLVKGKEAEWKQLQDAQQVLEAHHHQRAAS